MYVLIAHYAQVPALVEPHIPAHGAWVRQHIESGVFVAAGPKRNGLGGAILARSMPREELNRLLADDIYVSAGVAEYQVVELDFKATASTFEALKTL